MKKICLSLTSCFVAAALIAGNVDVFYTGPSGQGDLFYKAPSTGTTNLAMGVNGLYNITINPAYAIVFGDLTMNNAAVRTNVTVGGTLDVQGNIIGANDEYIVNNQDTYWKVSGHWVSLGDGTFNLGSSTQQWNYLYLKNDATMEALVVRDDVTFGTNVTCNKLTASKPVFTDASKILTSSGTLGADQGGTGVASPTDHAVLVGSGASAVTPITVGTSDQVLLGATSADPVFTTLSGDIGISGGVVAFTAGAITNEDIAATANIAATKIADEALVKTTVLTGEVAGVWNGLTINPSAVTSVKIADGTITNDDIATTAEIAATKIAGEALVKTTVHTGDVNGVWNALAISPGVIANDDIDANAAIAGTKIAGEALVKTSVLTGDVAGVWNALVIQPGVITNDDVDVNAAIASTKIAGEALTKSTVLTGAVSGVWNSLVINDDTVTNSMLSSGIDATKLAGDIASDRMTANGVVVSDFAAEGDVLVGSGAGTFTAINGTNAVVTIATTISTNVMYFSVGGTLVSNVYDGP